MNKKHIIANHYCLDVKGLDWYSDKKVSFRLFINKSRKKKLKYIKRIVSKKAQKMLSSNIKYSWFRIEIKSENKYVIGNYHLDDLVRNNDLNPHCIRVLVDFPEGLGAAGSLGDTIKMEIRARETEHNNRPHIHIYKRKNRGVSIALWDFCVLCGKNNWQKEFSGKERREIIKTIKASRNEFINFYIELQKGYYPDSVCYRYQGEDYWLKCKA